MDPRHPLRIGKDYYPDASVRANEWDDCGAGDRALMAIIAASIQTAPVSTAWIRLLECRERATHASCNRRRQAIEGTVAIQ